MQRSALVAAIGVAAGFCLACGGIASSAGKDSLGDCLALLTPVENSPEKAQVRAMIEEAYVQVHRGDLGLFKVSTFKVHLEHAVEDGTITLTELSGLQSDATWMAHPAAISPTERAALLAGLEEGAAASSPRSLAQWDQSDLSRRATTLGWIVSDCYSYDDYGYRETTCTLQKTDLLATVTLTTHPDEESARWYDEPSYGPVVREGRTVLTATVSDSAAGERLSDLMIPDPKTIPADASYFRARVEPSGWMVADVYTSRDPSGESLSFSATKGDQRADAYVYIYFSGMSSGYSRSTSYGSVSITSGRASFSVTVSDKAAARRLLADLTS